MVVAPEFPLVFGSTRVRMGVCDDATGEGCFYQGHDVEDDPLPDMARKEGGLDGGLFFDGPQDPDHQQH